MEARGDSGAQALVNIRIWGDIEGHRVKLL